MTGGRSAMLATAMLAVGLLGSASQAKADDLPLQTTVRLGRPARDLTLRIANVDGGVEVALGTSRHTLPGITASSVTSEVIGLSGGGAVALVTIDSPPEQRLILVGFQRERMNVIWSDRNGLRGDPGERRGYVLIRQDRNGDGVAELGFVEHHEPIRTCGNDWVPVRARWLDPRTLTLGAAGQTVGPFLTPASAPTEVQAGSTPEGFAEHPRIATLRGRWTDAGATMDALSPLPDGTPLFDRDPETTLAVPARTGLRATLGVSAAGMGARGLAITTSGSSSTTHDLLFRGDDGPWFHVTLPIAQARTRHWIALPPGSTWRCVEVAVPAAPSPLSLAEIELFTDIDAPDGAATLMGRLVTDDRNGTEAARLLVSLGKPGFDALSSAWDGLGSRGKRRVVLALETIGTRSAEGRGLLARAANEADPELRDRALATLTAAPEAALAELMALATREGPGTDAAIKALGSLPRAETTALVLNLLTQSTRTAARTALEELVSTGDERVVGAIQAWIEANPPIAAQSMAMASLVLHPATRPGAQAIWARLSPQALEFEDLWRVVLATGGLPPSPDVDGWLAHLAEHDERWMVRDAALASLRARSSERAVPLALGRLDDEYPRVRARAVTVLATVPTQQATLQTRFATEPWPMVRAAILNELTSPDESRTLRRSALKDSAPQVRIAAIAASERLGDSGIWAEVAPLARSNDEWPSVIAAAIQFARARCITQATSDLRVVLKRGLKPDAWAPDVDLAMEAIEALGRFGTPDAQALLRSAQSQEQPPAVRDAASRALARPPECRTAEASATPTVAAPNRGPTEAETTAQ